MRTAVFNKPVLTAAAILAALAGRADEDCCAHDRDPNSLSFSARFGFNIGARFKNPGRINFSINRETGDPDPAHAHDKYNYGGFDNASQVSPAATPNNHLALSRTVSADAVSSPWKDADLSLGGELVYRRELGTIPKLCDMRWGFEAAGNYANISLNDHATYSGTVTRQTDTYVPFQDATITDPRQGTFNGPGTLLNDTPISSALTGGAATISGRRKIDADMWGFRVGPYVEMPLAKHLNASLSGGFAGALLNVDASWQETLAVGSAQYPFSGGGNKTDWRFGYYLAANADYQFSEDWSVVVGVQYQSLANYQQAISGRTVELDLSNAIFVTLGLSYRF
jgi:opacity protein-like surface antigen